MTTMAFGLGKPSPGQKLQIGTPEVNIETIKKKQKNNSLDFHCSVQMERQTVKTLSQKEQSNLGLHSFVGSISPNT